MTNPFTDLIKAARDLIVSAHEYTSRDSQVPTEAIVRLRHAAARAATALATPPTPSECALATNERARAGVAETTLGVTGAGDQLGSDQDISDRAHGLPAGDPPLVSLGQGAYVHGIDAKGKPFPPHPRAAGFPIARTAHGQDVEVGPAGHVEPRA